MAFLIFPYVFDTPKNANPTKSTQILHASDANPMQIPHTEHRKEVHMWAPDVLSVALWAQVPQHTSRCAYPNQTYSHTQHTHHATHTHTQHARTHARAHTHTNKHTNKHTNRHTHTPTHKHTQTHTNAQKTNKQTN